MKNYSSLNLESLGQAACDEEQVISEIGLKVTVNGKSRGSFEDVETRNGIFAGTNDRVEGENSTPIKMDQICCDPM